MSFAITTAFVQQYKTTVALLLQQKNSRFSPAVMQDTFVGKAASMLEQFGSVTPARNAPRHADTPLIATPGAFWIIFGIMVIGMIALTVYFKRKGWF